MNILPKFLKSKKTLLFLGILFVLFFIRAEQVYAQCCPTGYLCTGPCSYTDPGGWECRGSCVPSGEYGETFLPPPPGGPTPTPEPPPPEVTPPPDQPPGETLTSQCCPTLESPCQVCYVSGGSVVDTGTDAACCSAEPALPPLPIFDDVTATCPSSPLFFWEYGKGRTNLMTNVSFETVTDYDGDTLEDDCSGKCDNRSVGSERDECADNGWPRQPAGWTSSFRTCWRPNNWAAQPETVAAVKMDGPSDAPDGTNISPKHGSWLVHAGCGDEQSWFADPQPDGHWTCQERYQRHGWDVSQVVSGLVPDRAYFFLARVRGRGTQYATRACWAEGYTEARITSGTLHTVEKDEVIWFGIGDHGGANGDWVYWNPTIRLTNSSVTTTYRPWDISDDDFSTQGPIWYYKGPGENPKDAPNLTYSSGSGCVYDTSRPCWYNLSWPWQVISKTYMAPWLCGCEGTRYHHWFGWKAPSDGIVEIEGTVTALQDPDGQVDVAIFYEDEKLWSESLEGRGETKEYYFTDELLEFEPDGVVDTGFIEAGGDDAWATISPWFYAPPNGMVKIELRGTRGKAQEGDCGGWSPTGVADWLQLVEVCWDGVCSGGDSPDSALFVVGQPSGKTAEMQFSNDGGVTWGKWADEVTGQISGGLCSASPASCPSVNWMPWSSVIKWNYGTDLSSPVWTNGVRVRFRNQRDEQQKIAECGAMPLVDSSTCILSGATSGVVAERLSYTAQARGRNLTKVEILASPTVQESWQLIAKKEDCSGDSCSLTGSWDTSSLDPSSWPDNSKSYYLVCKAYDASAGQCSGNPWCWDIPPASGCSGWSDCGLQDKLTTSLERCHTENLRCTPSGGDNILEWQLDGIQAADGTYVWGGANGVVLKKDSADLCFRPWSGPAPGVGQTSCYDYDVTSEHLYQSACYRGDATNIFGWELEECGSTPPPDGGTGGATCTF